MMFVLCIFYMLPALAGLACLNCGLIFGTVLCCTVVT